MDSRTVVIIEDEPVARSEAVELFETAGMNTVAFARGDEAIDYVRAHRSEIACVFTDWIVQGGIDGIEAANSMIKALPGVPVVMTSGALLARPRGLDLSVRFLPKPWNPADVINAVRGGKPKGQN